LNLAAPMPVRLLDVLERRQDDTSDSIPGHTSRGWFPLAQSRLCASPRGLQPHQCVCVLRGVLGS
jgi:hypothetical protein